MRRATRFAERDRWTGAGRSAGLALLLVAVACADDPAAPPDPGALRVVVRTTGGDLDTDGYDVVVNGVVWRELLIGESAALQAAEVGSYTVTLGRVDANCAIQGEAVRTVTVSARATAEVVFDVVCVVTGLAVTINATGFDVPDELRVTLNGAPPVAVPGHGTRTLSRLAPATYAVELLAATNCVVVGERSITVTVAAGTTVPVVFEVSCALVERPERIAFVFDSLVDDLWQPWIGLVRPDGSGRVTLAPGHTPSWSPDRRRLLYSTTVCPYYYYRDTGCSGGLMVRDAELGRAVELLAATEGLEPAWSRADGRVAFVRCCTDNGLYGPLYILVLDDPVGPRPVSLPTVLHVTDPAWSPDGRRVAFTCRVGTELSGDWFTNICLVNADGSGFVRLTSGTTTVDTDPAWSPDGRRIAFSRYGSGRPYEVIVAPVDAGSTTTLGEGRWPAWSPDGTRIVFAANDGLFLMNADGSNRTRLTTGFNYAPAWRP